MSKVGIGKYFTLLVGAIAGLIIGSSLRPSGTTSGFSYGRDWLALSEAEKISAVQMMTVAYQTAWLQGYTLRFVQDAPGTDAAKEAYAKRFDIERKALEPTFRRPASQYASDITSYYANVASPRTPAGLLGCLADNVRESSVSYYDSQMGVIGCPPDVRSIIRSGEQFPGAYPDATSSP